MKVNTIDQFYILKEIEKYFDLDSVHLGLTASNKITVTNRSDSITFTRHSDGFISTGDE